MLTHFDLIAIWVMGWLAKGVVLLFGPVARVHRDEESTSPTSMA